MLLSLILLICSFSAIWQLSNHSLKFCDKTKFSQALMLIIFVLSICSPLFITNTDSWRVAITGPLGANFYIMLYYDSLTWLMISLVSFISLIIHGYSARFLLFDQNQTRFMGQLSLLTLSVLLLMMSSNLLTAFVAWQFIGITLYLLLNHYHYSPKANRAAKKKFIINRVGDICFLIAVIMCLQKYGTTEFQFLIQNSKNMDSLILGLIFVAIMTKSAQFPFHIWLIDTMEAPTPVSALMHAGVINAGGFLLARLSPLYSQFPNLLLLIFFSGLLTALLGTLLMSNQPDTKKKLAYSTMSQMGYMIMQCGLGCFISAIYHLIAHSFLKATLFLSAGGSLKQTHQKSIYNGASNKAWTYSASLVISVLLISTGYLALFLTNSNMNILLWLFIGISLFQLSSDVLTNSNTTFKKIINLSFIGIFYYTYLYFFKNLNTLLGMNIIENEYSTIGIIFSIIALATILAIKITGAVKKNNKFINFAKNEVGTLIIKLHNIEYLYRKYLINPLRAAGDKMITIYFKVPEHTRGYCAAVFFIIFSSICLVFVWGSSKDNIISINFFIAVNLAMFLVTLIIANRVKELPQIIYTILVSLIIFNNLIFLVGKPGYNNAGMYQLINNTLLISGLLLLLIKRNGNKQEISSLENRLPWCHFYISIFLIMLIGIPGTASFISELYILDSLLKINFIFAATLGGCMLLLALVVLHTLQTYFFNSEQIKKFAIQINPSLHVILLSIICLNIFNGIYPTFLLTLFSNTLGV